MQNADCTFRDFRVQVFRVFRGLSHPFAYVRRAALHCSNVRRDVFAGVVKSVDTEDLKSSSPRGECGFDSRPRHFRLLLFVHIFNLGLDGFATLH